MGVIGSTMERFGASVLVLLLGLTVTLTTFSLLRSAEIAQSRQRFASWSEDHRNTLQRNLDAHVEVLYGVTALFESSQHVSPREFKRFTAVALRRYPGIRSLDWLPRVPHERRASFEMDLQPKRHTPILGPDKRPSAERTEYFPLLYAQPESNAERVGIDAAQEPGAVAMHRALATGEAAAAPVTLVASSDDLPTTLYIYLPVYRPISDGSPAGTGELQGFVRSVFSLSEVLEHTIGYVRVHGAMAALHDPATQRVLVNVGHTPHVAAARRTNLLSVDQIRIADLQYELRFQSIDDAQWQPSLDQIWALLITGIAFTLVGMAAAYYLTASRLRLQSLTKKLTDEIREHRNSEERLLQSETRYRVLVENSPDAIMITRGGRITFANAACVRLLAAPSAEALSGKWVYELVPAEDQERIRERMQRMYEHREVPPGIHQVLVRLDGTRVDTEVRSVPFVEDGDVAIQVTMRDITEQLSAERNRAKLEAALRQSQKLEAIGTLAGGIAHDFNNILSAIIGNTRLVLDDIPADHPATRSITEIRRATNRARDLVKRLLAFSQREESQRMPLLLPPLIFEVQQLLRATLPAAIEFTVRIPPDVPPVLGDPTQIHQVLLNLCTNAWQAMPSQVGRIEIELRVLSAKAASTEARTELKADQYVCMSVHDSGAGIAPEIIEHIFEPFFTTKQTGEGSGLGLAVVHGIVKSHEGAITVSSKVGAGTSFHVFLPAATGAVPPHLTTQRVAAYGANQHVLYIDDEEPLVFLAVRTLERSGYRCTGEVDAARAVELVRANPNQFDLVLTDMNMPRMGGLDVAREILALRPDLPIVITTGYIRAPDVATARQIGVRDVILKPDTIDQLSHLVQRYLK